MTKCSKQRILILLLVFGTCTASVDIEEENEGNFFHSLLRRLQGGYTKAPPQITFSFKCVSVNGVYLERSPGVTCSSVPGSEACPNRAEANGLWASATAGTLPSDQCNVAIANGRYSKATVSNGSYNSAKALAANSEVNIVNGNSNTVTIANSGTGASASVAGYFNSLTASGENSTSEVDGGNSNVIDITEAAKNSVVKVIKGFYNYLRAETEGAILEVEELNSQNIVN